MDVGPSPLEAEAIAAAAYIFGFPLVLSDAVHTAVANRKQAVFCEGGGAETMFCLDLREGSVTLQLSSGALLIRDAWTNVIAAPGPERAAGNEGRALVLVGPGWRGPVPAGGATIGAPTNLVWVVTSGLRGRRTAAISKPLLSAAVEWVSRMGAGTYLSRLARLMRWNPPAAADESLLARLRRIGIAPGEPTGLASLPADLRSALVSGIAAARAAMAAAAPALDARGPGIDYWGRALWSANGLVSGAARNFADS